MRKNFGPNTYFFPLPVIIIGTYDENGIPNAMNAAWGGIYDTNQVNICLSSDHKTTKNIKLNNEFTVFFGTKETIKESDYFGIETGEKINKIERVGFHTFKSELINAPVIEEYPLCLEVRVNKLEDDGTTTYLVGDIINVNAKEEVLTNGKIDLEKMNIIVYNPVTHSYNLVKDKAGQAFKDGMKFKS